MKQLLVCFSILMIQQAAAQPAATSGKAVEILKKTDAALSSFHRVNYRFTRETRYFSDNYYNLFTADMYMENMDNSPIGFRFQATTEGAGFVYDGSLTMRLDNKNMTIDSASAKTAAKMDNNSYLYHSLAMLRNILPVILQNDSIEKSVSDTTIGGKQLYNIRIERPKMYFQLFRGMATVGVADLRRPYYLLVDKQTFLPYQFIAKYIRGNDDRDFVTVTYKEINIHPATPAADSWLYATYAKTYQPYKPAEKKPMIQAGAIVSDFTLPDYTPAGVGNVSLHQYAGKVVLLDFWFKSCGPCMEAMPHYNLLQQKFGADRFQLLTINVGDDEKDIQFFYNKYQPVYRMLFKGDKLFERLGFSGCPSSILVDKNGKVLQTFMGFNQPVLEKAIEEAIGKS